MRAGELRHRITIQQATITRDATNMEIPTWSDLATVWAKVESTTSGEYADAAREGASITHKITIRERADLTVLMRVVFDERVLAIAAPPLHDNLERQCVLLCTEVV